MNGKKGSASLGIRAFRSVVRDYQLWIMIIPAIIVVFIFNYMPMYGIQLAFVTSILLKV